ncbi:prolyl oligopeptidase family serine peptidase [uncultured Croceitalea sp.]|uniref:prolyl oligopeptidase family serine peptidase n=1 Tax=uncultured Croceitalea sp. TaxID=1798908 RepID=UPI003305610A
MIKDQPTEWNKKIIEVEILSSIDGEIQKAKAFHAREVNRPLIISLHTWSSNYNKYDPISEFALNNDYNYIHPDFRGANNKGESCCSDKVISDIDDAIRYMLKRGSSREQTYMIGLSGGAYTLFCSYLRSDYTISSYYAWNGISDLRSWAAQSKIKYRNYYDDIVSCTSNDGYLKRSPLYMEFKDVSNERGKLHIFAGISDGKTGSVPYTHSIDFYNKIVRSNSSYNPEHAVSEVEIQRLHNFKSGEKKYRNIGKRAIVLEKKSPLVELIIFEGGHEMLTDFTVKTILKDNND